MGRAIVITSGKGGVGKTTLTAYVGRVLAAMELKVVLVDTDMGLNNLDVLMQVDNKIVYDMVDVIENRCRVSQAIVESDTANLYVLPSCHSYDKSRVDAQSVRAVVAALKTRFDYVLIDCPAGIELGFHRAVAAADEALVVTTPHVSALQDAKKVVNLLKSYAVKSVSCVLNRVRGDKEIIAESLSHEDVREYLGVPVVGVIPEDDAVGGLSACFAPVSRRSEGYKATQMLCKNLHYGTTGLYDAQRKYRGFLGEIKRRMKKIT